MMDLSVKGLGGVDSVGGLLGADGALTAGEAPAGCMARLPSQDGPQTTHLDKQQGSASLQSHHDKRSDRTKKTHWTGSTDTVFSDERHV